MSHERNKSWPWLLAWAAWAVGTRVAVPRLAELLAPGWLDAEGVLFRLGWATFAIPVPFVAGVMWSMRREAAQRAALVARLAGGDGTVLGSALELLAVLAKAGDFALGDQLAKVLTGWAAQLPAPEYAALLGAMEAWRAAAGFGSGAFHGDGWASLGLMEKQDAVAVAAQALTRALQQPRA